MSDTSNRLIKWVVSIVFIVIGVVCFIIHRRNPNHDSIMSLIGSLCSLFGLVIAIIQIQKSTKASIESKNAAEMTKTAVDNNIKELNKYLSYSTITQCEKLIDEIETLIHSKSNDRLFLRMKELKDQLIDIQKNPKLKRQINKNCGSNFDNNIIQIKFDIDAISTLLNNNNIPVNFNTILTHVESIKTDLTKIACELKYEKL